MNTTTRQPFAPTVNFTDWVMATVRGWIGGVVPTGTPLSDTAAAVLPRRRICALTAVGHEGAGLFGRTTDPVAVVRIRPSPSDTKTPGAATYTKADAHLARPGFARSAAKTANRTVVIR